MSTEQTSLPAPVPVSADAARRRWLLGGAAVAAGVAGAGLSWWRQQPPASEPTAEASFWSLRLETPAGTELPVAGFRGKPLLLNFWATWCPPCVEELPLLNHFYRENVSKGWQVLGLAVDQAAAVRGFLGRVPVDFSIAMAGLNGVALSKSFGNLSGGLPFTVVLGSESRVLHRKMGSVKPDDLSSWATLK